MVISNTTEATVQAELDTVQKRMVGALNFLSDQCKLTARRIFQIQAWHMLG